MKIGKILEFFEFCPSKNSYIKNYMKPQLLKRSFKLMDFFDSPTEALEVIVATVVTGVEVSGLDSSSPVDS